MEELDKRRVLFLSGDIDEASTKEVIEKLREWNLFDDSKEALLKEYVRPEIELLIDSYGGHYYSAMGIASVIASSKTPVHTICVGKSMSAGFIILIAGHRRSAYALSTMMYHQLSGGVIGKLTEMVEKTEESLKMEEVMDAFVIYRTNIKPKKLKKINKAKKDWFMDTEKALKLGVIDEIL